MSMSTSDEEMASRPMQLPKVGWDDADGDNTTAEEVEMPSLSTKDTSSDDGVTQRANIAPARNAIDDLAPIPEDYSMHGGWPDSYSDIFCYPYGVDYDDSRRKGYRYRFCRRLCQDRRYRLLGIILVIGTIVIYATSFSRWGGQSSNLTGEPLENREQSERYEMAATTYHPRSFGRDDGWAGSNYLAAMEFCLKKNKNIPCPYDAYCPLGEGEMPMGGFKEEHEGSWAPFFSEGSVNEWVSLSRGNPCQKYSTMFDEKPSWGLTGKDAEGFTRHVACCLNVKEGSSSTLYNEMSSDVIARPPLLEEDLADIMDDNP